jgi:hypothetical protein
MKTNSSMAEARNNTSLIVVYTATLHQLRMLSGIDMDRKIIMDDKESEKTHF